jgi:hypothetical protein
VLRDRRPLIQSSAESEDELCRGAEILFIELRFEIVAFQSSISLRLDRVAKKARSVARC